MSDTSATTAGASGTARGEGDDLLALTQLAVQLDTAEPIGLVTDATFQVRSGSTLGLVGESGSGKSLTALSIMGLLPPGLRLRSGSIRFQGQELTALDASEYRRVRGRQIGMIFQDPQNSLNPAFTIGNQLVETIREHRDVSTRDARARAVEVLGRVGIPSAADRLGDYPHQFSGGMAQRVMIALAIVSEPSLLIADEPTTALDVTVQAQILELLCSLRDEIGMALLLISHDLSVIAQMADEVAVMYAGEVVERGTVSDVFGAPQHPYTDALLRAQPDAVDHAGRLRVIPGNVPEAGHAPAGCRFHDRCAHADERCMTVHPDLVARGGTWTRCVRAGELTLDGIGAAVSGPRPSRPVAPAAGPLLRLHDVTKDFRLGGRIAGRGSTLRAVSGATFDVAPGETLGLVGESGAGKSTVGRLVLGLERPTSGTVEFDGADVHRVGRAARRRLGREISVVFQNPYASLDPSMNVGEAVVEPLRAHERMPRAARAQRAAELLDQVGLASRYRRRYPHELSGGQRQRVAVARALAVRPRLVVCDEAVSSLDVSTQAQVLNLLSDLQGEFGLAYLFIGHDLAVVHHISDRIAVMYRGEVAEIGPADEVYLRPRHPYTRVLLGAVLSIDPSARQLRPSVGSVDPVAPSTGCPFAHRCPDVMDRCREVAPVLEPAGPVEVSCHLYSVPDSVPSAGS